MRYVIARYGEYQDEMAYRIYISDRLYRDSKNYYLPIDERYVDFIKPKKKAPQKTGDEIVAEVIAKAGLVVKK